MNLGKAGSVWKFLYSRSCSMHFDDEVVLSLSRSLVHFVNRFRGGGGTISLLAPGTEIPVYATKRWWWWWWWQWCTLAYEYIYNITTVCKQWINYSHLGQNFHGWCAPRWKKKLIIRGLFAPFPEIYINFFSKHNELLRLMQKMSNIYFYRGAYTLQALLFSRPSFPFNLTFIFFNVFIVLYCSNWSICILIWQYVKMYHYCKYEQLREEK